METLLEDYKRKLETVNGLIKQCENDERIMSQDSYKRVAIKASLYRSFIVDIERAIKRIKLTT